MTVGQLEVNLVEALITLAAALCTKVLFPEVFGYIKERCKFLRNSNVINKVESIVSASTSSLAETEVNKLKASGKWTPEIGKQLRQDVVDTTANTLTDVEKATLTEISGDAEDYIGKLVDKKVGELQASGIQHKLSQIANPPSSPASQQPPSSGAQQ